jgi:hypothetical protein
LSAAPRPTARNELVDGERRYRAARQAELTEVPVIITAREAVVTKRSVQGLPLSSSSQPTIIVKMLELFDVQAAASLGSLTSTY